MKRNSGHNGTTIGVSRGALFAALAVGAATAIQAAEPAGFTNYTQKVDGQTFTIDMVAIPGGSITIGSPENEPGREKSDLAQKKVTVKPFYMAKFETSWQQFLPFVFFPREEVVRDVDKLEGIVDKDGISHPTKPYGSVYRERGEKGYPAIGMGQPNAREYCKWLSKKTGFKFRLPTEEEWEYACRAGATTPYFWGEDGSKAKEFAWYKDDSGDTTHPIGKLKPNPFGLYDIAGNVAEWTHKPNTNAPGVARGGAWSEPLAKLRSAARMVETPEWNELDPQIPQSIWWLSAADFVGFRVVREIDDGQAAKAEAPAAAAKTADAAPAAATAAVDDNKAKAQYKQFCAGCHGLTGKGDTKIGQRNGARDYSDSKVKATLKDEDMFKAVKEGLTKDGKQVMHPIGDKMTDDEIKAVVAYMKSF